MKKYRLSSLGKLCLETIQSRNRKKFDKIPLKKFWGWMLKHETQEEKTDRLINTHLLREISELL